MSRETFSRFGGLWIDRMDCDAELARRTVAGTFPEEVSRLIQSFMQDSFVIIKSTMSKNLTVAIKSELEQH